MDGAIKLLNTFDITFKLKYEQRKIIIQYLNLLVPFKKIMDEFYDEIIKFREEN